MARADHTVKIRLEGEDNASQAFEGAEKSSRSFGKYLSDHFVVTFGDVTRAVSKGFESLQKAVTLEAQETALRAQLGAVDQDFDEFIAKLKNVSDNTISTADAISSSSRALLLGIPADEISGLLEGARVAAVGMGMSVSKAFEDITTGIARASPMILDNLGFSISLGEVYNKAAKELHKTAEEMTKIEKSAALMNLVLDQSAERAAVLQEALIGIPTTLAQLEAESADTERAVGKLLIRMSEGATRGLEFNDTIGQTSENVAKLEDASFKFGLVLSSIAERGIDAWRNPLAAIGLYQEALLVTNAEIVKVTDNTENLEKATEDEAVALAKSTEAFKDLQNAQAGVVASSDEYAAALDKLGVSLEGNVNTQIAQNIALLTESEVLYAQKIITATDLERIENAVAEANERLTASLTDQNNALVSNVGYWDTAAAGAQRYRDVTLAASDALQNFTQASNANLGAPEAGPRPTPTLAGLTVVDGVVVDLYGREFFGFSPAGTPISSIYGTPSEVGLQLQEKFANYRRFGSLFGFRSVA